MISKIAATLLLVFRSTLATEDCLLRDDEHVSGAQSMVELKGMTDANWVDDGEILREKWTVGMGIRAVNYCIDDSDQWFKSMQLLIGESEEEDVEKLQKLRKHGAAGGTCYRWTLLPNDYIRKVQYSWNWQHSMVVQVVFQTHLKQTRVIGKGQGRKVNYEYSAFQPLVGFFSFEAD